MIQRRVGGMESMSKEGGLWMESRGRTDPRPPGRVNEIVLEVNWLGKRSRPGSGASSNGEEEGNLSGLLGDVVGGEGCADQ